MSDLFLRWLAEHGAIGILAIGLSYGLKIVWADNRRLQQKLDDVQEKRIAERDSFVKIITENTRVLAEWADAPPRRR